MNDPQLSRLFVLSCRPDPDGSGRAEVLRLAGAVLDWDRALAKAEGEGILPLLYWGLRDDPGAVPGPVLEKLRLAFLRNLARTTQLYREMEPFLGSVRLSGLRAALTKGGRLAFDVYPDIALRPFWDVDFIVHPSDWTELRRILDSLGFVEASAGPSGPALDWAYSPYFRKGPLFLEFHGNPLGLHFPSRGEDGFWSSAGRLRVRGTEALVLPAENELCYLCVHAQQHSYQRLIWLADIARLAGRAGLDWSWVARIARDERIKGPVYYGLHLADAALARFRPGGAARRACGPVPPRWPGSGSSGPRPRRPPAPRRRPGPITCLRSSRSGSGATPPWPRACWVRYSSRRGHGSHRRRAIPASSPRLYGRYVERLLRPAVTAARRMMERG